MNKLKFIFPLMGIAFTGLWLVKTMSYVEAESASFTSVSTAAIKYQYLALMGFACFYAYPAITWIRSGATFRSSKIISALKEDMHPTYGKQIPVWGHVLRLIGFLTILYSMIGAVKVVNDQIVFNLKYVFPAALGGAVFFLLPFVFQRKTQ